MTDTSYTEDRQQTHIWRLDSRDTDGDPTQDTKMEDKYQKAQIYETQIDDRHQAHRWKTDTKYAGQTRSLSLELYKQRMAKSLEFLN